jgi:hypothetical protein
VSRNRLWHGLQLRQRSARDMASVAPFAPRTAADIDLSMVEVKQLWCDLSGSSVMNAGARRRLVRSWGPCPRHAWALAIVEIELRGGVPFTVAILYADLVSRAAAGLRDAARWEDHPERTLAPRDICISCEYCSFAGADPIFEEKTRRANGRRRAHATLMASRDVWAFQACPRCIAGGLGMPCRPHLLADATSLPRELPGYLDELGSRLQRFQKSMTWQGPTASPSARASWVEALGFFAGWRVPFVLTNRP